MNKFVNKHFCTLLAVVCPLIAARADLTLEQKAGDGRHTHDLVTKIHGDKMRIDLSDDGISFIFDLKTHDSITLMHRAKTFQNHAGAELQRQADAENAREGTNAAGQGRPAARPTSTGKTEKVGGYDTEIYTWTGERGLTETLWVAKNFPNYDLIKVDLAKMDRFNANGANKGSQPEVSLLPGMVVKTDSLSQRQKGTITLVSSKTDPVDASVFDVPAGYTAWKSPFPTHKP